MIKNEIKQNRLKNEKSPYLLQHSQNPVDWWPWCGEAFEKAKEEDKPVFLSIGYSTCHWCHVMEKESFEDNEVADILNKHFIAIKVDREERPDIDSVYMNVTQMLTGSGGWPMSIFMDWQKRPFFAGTYFPKKSGKYGLGFITLLDRIIRMWADDRHKLDGMASEIISKLREWDQTQEIDYISAIKSGYHQLFKSFDSKYGGFGIAPKFPTPHNLMFLLRYYHAYKDLSSLEMVEKTLASMYRGWHS